MYICGLIKDLTINVYTKSNIPIMYKINIGFKGNNGWMIDRELWDEANVLKKARCEFKGIVQYKY